MSKGSSVSGGIFDVNQKLLKIKELDKQAAAPGFWNDNETAQKNQRKRSALQGSVVLWKNLNDESEDIDAMVALSEEEGDDSMLEEIGSLLSGLETRLGETELKAMLSGENDSNSAILTINSGAGGTESQDWAMMLLRMYTSWADRNGYKMEVMDIQHGEEAGIKSATANIIGEFAYGYLKAEIGVHRLVRISPFDSNKRRHTSFASVFVFPEIDDSITVDIKEDELKIDVYRASGPGGQGVNTTDSAVRITHIPTGIVVQCQNERSQHKNKSSGMKVLKARLYEAELEKQNAEKKDMAKDMKKIEWGSQIRSYVLHPYRMAKDLRTNIEIGNVDAVLDGDLDRFIEAFLMKENLNN